MEHHIDLMGSTVQQSIEQVQVQFEKLGSKESIILKLGDKGGVLIDHFQGRFWGEFEWAPLQLGPPVWQFVMIRTPSKISKRSVREFLGSDHRRCDELFSQMENASQAGDLAGATSFFGQFRTGMDHHFDMEENAFFPAFEKATGMTQGPTMVMRMEHRQMQGLIGQMAQAMEQGKLDGVNRAISTLMILMRQHNIKEEQMLYPMADQHLGEMTDGLVRSMQKMI